MKNKLILVLAVVFGLIAAFGVIKYLQNVKETYREAGNYSEIVIAAQNIPAKTPITQQMLQTREVPADSILPGSVMEAKDAVGKISRTEIFKGEQLLQKKLINKDDTKLFASKIEPGMRAVTIPVQNISAVAGFVTPGDRVDVTLTRKEEEYGDTVTATVLHNLTIMAINQTTSPQKDKIQEPSSATFLVDPREAQELILANKSGTIQLMLRSPQDGQVEGIPPAQQKQLIR